MDAAVLQFGAIFVAVGHLASSIVLAALLGSEQQGIYYAALALFGVVYLLGSFGFATATVSRIAACHASSDSAGITHCLGRLTRTWFLLGLILIPVGFFLLPWIAGFGLGGEPVSAMIAWLCLTPLLELPRIVARAALEGGRRMFAVSILDGGLEMLRAGFVCAAVFYEPSPMSAVLGHVIATSIGIPLSLILYGQARRRKANGLLPTILEVLRASRKISTGGHARLGIELGLSRFSRGLLLEFAPPLLLLHFASASWVTYYRITHRLLGLPFLVTQSVSRVSLPALSQLAAISNWSQFRASFRRITVVTGLIRCAAFVIWIPLIPWVTRTFYPEGYAEGVWQFTTASILGIVALSFTAALESFYVATDSVRVALKINLFISALMGSLLVLLSAQFGELGTIWALSIGACGSLVHHVHINKAFARRVDDLSERSA